MRRVGGLWSTLVSFQTLLAAAWRAARNKRQSASVAPFLERREFEVLRLERELGAGTWRPGRAHTFRILDPKPRTITALPFRDHVVHHALMTVLEPVFERRMVAHSYACRKQKGQHRALRHAQTLLRRHERFLVLDVERFFASLQHQVVLASLQRCVKDRRVLELCATILAGTPAAALSAPQRGLALGSLASQWFANLVLDRLDHHVLEVLRPGGYVRYMDDLVLFDDSRALLAEAEGEIGRFLGTLGLMLKARATRHAPAHAGLPFLGWMVFRGTLRLRPENRRRYRWRLRVARRELARGWRSEESYRQAVRAVYELLRQGGTLALRRRWSGEDLMDL